MTLQGCHENTGSWETSGRACTCPPASQSLLATAWKIRPELPQQALGMNNSGERHLVQRDHIKRSFCCLSSERQEPLLH